MTLLKSVPLVRIFRAAAFVPARKIPTDGDDIKLSRRPFAISLRNPLSSDDNAAEARTVMRIAREMRGDAGRQKTLSVIVRRVI
jgi:hypothetical protein